MARSARKSLAGTAAAAAKKVIGQESGSAEDDAASSETDPAAPATGAAAGKPAKKPATKKLAVKQDAPVKRDTPPHPANDARTSTATKVAPAKKAPVKKADAVKKDTPPQKGGPAASASAGSLAVKEGDEPWTDADLTEVVDELHLHRDRLRSLIEAQELELAGLMKDAGDGAGHDQADMGATSFERDHELTVVNQERDMLAQIERALGRIDDGTYGVCESCEQPIGKMRVMAFPRATLCLTCKQREERR